MPKPLDQLAVLLQDAARIAVLAVGSSLRADDAAGMLAAEQVTRRLAGRSTRAATEVFLGETAPENLTGEIRRFNPTHLVIVDAADLSGKVGSIDVLNADAATGGASFSSHAMPVGVLGNYMRSSCGCAVIIVGIQPASRQFCGPVSPIVRAAANRVAAALVAAAG